MTSFERKRKASIRPVSRLGGRAGLRPAPVSGRHAGVPLNAQVVAPDDGGKRARTKARNRDAILAAARSVFSELGYEAASVRDIIRRTNLASGTFYNYFQSKEEVAEALAGDALQRLRQVVSAQHVGEDFEAYLNGILRAFFHFLVTEEKLWPLSQPREKRFPRVRVQTPERFAIYEEIKASIALAIERGLAPRVDKGFLTVAIMGLAHNMGETMLARRPHDPDAAADFAVSLILKGLAAVPRSEKPRSSR
jgi:AcrR family transcriptional regulator